MWSSKLFRKFFTAFAALIVLSLLLFGVLVARGHERELRNQLAERLRVASALLERVAVNHLATNAVKVTEVDALQRLVQDLGKASHIRFTVMTMDGEVLADSDRADLDAVRRMDNYRERPEVRAAINTGTGVSERYSQTLKEPLFYHAAQVVDTDGSLLGVVRSALPVRTIQRQVRQGRQMVMLFAAMMILVSLLGTRQLLSRIIEPLVQIDRTVQRMAAGKLGDHVHVSNRDELGMVARSLNILNDVLMQRIEQLRQRRDQLAAVLGRMEEGVVAVDQRQRIVFANGAAGELLGFGTEQANGRPLPTLVRDNVLREAVHQAATTRDVVNTEIERQSPRKATIAIHAQPLPGEPCPGVVIVFYDVTQLRRLESLRQEFVANVSHELKTPLSSIKAYSETLREGAINDQSNNLKFVKRIEDQADRLNQLIIDLISVARIESGEQSFDLEDVPLNDAVQLCINDHLAAAEAKSIRLTAEAPSETLVVLADAEAVRQILENLVNNAIKYTPVDGEVTVRWCRDGEHALIEVCDTGLGIGKGHQSRLFERFYRVDKARSRELGGTGLGLSIVKHLTQFFGGTVGVVSELNEGSTFWVRLPVSKKI